MKPFNRKFNFFLLLIFTISLLLFTALSCDTTEPPVEIPPIPTTEVEGPGGPAYLFGFIKDYVHDSKVVSNTHIYIMNHQDYNDTLLHVFVNSTDASFKITEMPEGVYDLIFMNDKYLCAKLGKLLFKLAGNTFYNPNSGGYFIDSTIYITSIADSVGRPDAPEFGLQGYGQAITVYLKSETADNIGWQIVQDSGCDTLRVDRYNDPVFDPFENDVYYLHCHNIENIKNKLIYFNYQEAILIASPVYKVIDH
ncbi:MAG: hypothetical protein K9H48_08410 [Melioribacteraceae bacterium]|nr:hypothetical protein [Melioribacteraceae bacterium]MCF8394071.1 hypothetical protein [Melioribacteraceae bacterium]MCF8419837.1 hypothetical protein [Melioribacteraceae bacterium]